MISAKISREISWGFVDFITVSDPHFHVSWDKNKKLYRLRDFIIPNWTRISRPRTIGLPANICLLGNYAITQWMWSLAILLVRHTICNCPGTQPNLNLQYQWEKKTIVPILFG